MSLLLAKRAAIGSGPPGRIVWWGWLIVVGRYLCPGWGFSLKLSECWQSESIGWINEIQSRTFEHALIGGRVQQLFMYIIIVVKRILNYWRADANTLRSSWLLLVYSSWVLSYRSLSPNLGREEALLMT